MTGGSWAWSWTSGSAGGGSSGSSGSDGPSPTWGSPPPSMTSWFIRHCRGEELAEKYLRKLQGYSIAEEFMTFPHYVQERRGHFLNHVGLMMMQWVPRR